MPKMEKKKKKIVLTIVAMSLSKMEKKKENSFGNWGNGIAKNGEKKRDVTNSVKE